MRFKSYCYFNKASFFLAFFSYLKFIFGGSGFYSLGFSSSPSSASSTASYYLFYVSSALSLSLFCYSSDDAWSAGFISVFSSLSESPPIISNGFFCVTITYYCCFYIVFLLFHLFRSESPFNFSFSLQAMLFFIVRNNCPYWSNGFLNILLSFRFLCLHLLSLFHGLHILFFLLTRLVTFRSVKLIPVNLYITWKYTLCGDCLLGLLLRLGHLVMIIIQI